METEKVRWQGVRLACGVFLLAILPNPALWAQSPQEPRPGVIPPRDAESLWGSREPGFLEG